MMRNKLLIIFIVIFLGGCTMIPKYKRPQSPIPSSWPSGPAYKEPGPGVPKANDLKWEEFLTDEQLKKIIHMALKNNRDLRLASLNMQRAWAFYGIQRAELLPTFDMIGRGSKERIPSDLSETGRRMTRERYSFDLGILSWEIDFFGRVRSLTDKALEEYLATEEARRSAEISLLSAVANTYLSLAADKEILKLSRSTLETQESVYKLIKRRYEVGLASVLDIHRAQTQVEVARGDVARYTKLVAEGENTLNLMVGTQVPGELLPSEFSHISPPKEISSGVTSDILLNRPDILAAEHQLKALNANIGAARAAFFPRISLMTTLGTASSELSGLFKSGSGAWSFIPQIITPIFDARTWRALKAVKVEREIALTQYEKAIQTAFKEVADALAQRGTIGEQILAQESLVQALKETYRLAYLRYIKGIDSYLSVLDSQRSLYAAEQGLIALRLAELTNLVTLYKVLGGGDRVNGSQ
ncbi:MAG: efflux transporter outer membrane subunit [Thermodesulfobacteriota bacterium]